VNPLEEFLVEADRVARSPWYVRRPRLAAVLVLTAVCCPVLLVAGLFVSSQLPSLDSDPYSNEVRPAASEEQVLRELAVLADEYADEQASNVRRAQDLVNEGTPGAYVEASVLLRRTKPEVLSPDDRHRWKLLWVHVHQKLAWPR
jgi:hypothetical protein